MPHWLSWASHLTQILLLTWKIAPCATHKGLQRGMSGMPTPAVLGYLLTLASLFILPYFIFHVLLPESFLVHPFHFIPLPTTIQVGQLQLQLSTVNTAKRFVMETQLKQWTLGQSLLGLGWMDELSGNQLCDERPRLHAGSDGEDTGFCQTQSKRGAPRLNCPEKNGCETRRGGSLEKC